MFSSTSQIQSGRHTLVWISGGFLAGVLYGIHQVTLPFSYFLSYSGGFLLLAGLLLLLLRKRFAKGDAFLVWLVCFSLVLGIVRVYLFDIFQDRDLQLTAGEECRYTGFLLDLPKESSTGASLGATVQVLQAENETGIHQVNGKVAVYAKDALYGELSRGDSVTFTAKLTQPEGAGYLGGFDYRHHLYRQGIRYATYTTELKRADTPVSHQSLSYTLESLGISIRESVFRAVDVSLFNHPQEAALLKGLLLGNNEGFTAEQYQSFVDSGLVHIISTSGMHLMFLFGLLQALLGRLRLPRWLLRLISVPVLVVFSAAAAFTPSICRSLIMLLLVLIAIQLQKEPDSLTSLSFAALLLVLQNPYTITGYSFLLSFSATLGIILFSAPLTQKLNTAIPVPDTKYARFFRREIQNSIVLSLSGNLGLGYFLARFFNRFSWGSIFANILLVPLASFSFAGGLILWLLSLLYPPLAIAFAQFFLALPLWLMNFLAHFFAQSRFLCYLPTPHPSFAVLYLLLGIVLYTYLTKKRA
ncbi:MAG: ComEC/Rec2 family competence protein [Clostridia bacterium]|nr:ComEC/Rec2 family competence protein [Clostridia bacterium]